MNKAVQQLAEEISSLYPIPIPLKDIVADEDISLICDDYGTDTFDGLTCYDYKDDKFYIHLNTARNNTPESNKGRFTLAHELGHYFIDRHRNAMIKGVMHPHWHKYNPFGENEEWKIEREADCFAGSLLMPFKSLKKDIRSNPFEGAMIDLLAKKYKVSFSAMAIRYKDLNEIPIMLVYAEKGFVKWQMHSEDFPFYKLYNSNYKVPTNTVMGEYFKNGDDCNSRKNEIVFAGDCFQTFNREQNDLPFFEYCIPYKDKAFSMFWQKY